MEDSIKATALTRGRPTGTGGAPSDAVRALRRKKGWSQQKLAEELHCSLSAVRFMERGRRLPGSIGLLETFKRLAADTGIALDFRESEETSA